MPRVKKTPEERALVPVGMDYWTGLAQDDGRVSKWVGKTCWAIVARQLKMPLGSNPENEPGAGAIAETIRITSSMLLADGLLPSEVALALASGLAGGLDAYLDTALRLTEKLAPKRVRGKYGANGDKAVGEMVDRISAALGEDTDAVREVEEGTEGA